MKPVLELISSLLARPDDRLERLTPWILTVLGGLFALIMLYAYCVAPVKP